MNINLKYLYLIPQKDEKYFERIRFHKEVKLKSAILTLNSGNYTELLYYNKKHKEFRSSLYGTPSYWFNVTFTDFIVT